MTSVVVAVAAIATMRNAIELLLAVVYTHLSTSSLRSVAPPRGLPEDKGAVGPSVLKGCKSAVGTPVSGPPRITAVIPIGIDEVRVAPKKGN